MLPNWRHLGAGIIAGLAVCLAATGVRAVSMDGIVMHHHVAMLMKNGKAATRLSHRITLTDGSTVQPNGTVERRSGIVRRLHDGDMIMMDGHIMHGTRAAPMQKEKAP